MKTKKSTTKKETALHPELCAQCGGTLEVKAVKIYERRNGALCIVNGVPACVCERCGEEWIAGHVLDQIERMVDERAPDQEEKIPAYHFPHTRDIARV